MAGPVFFQNAFLSEAGPNEQYSIAGLDVMTTDDRRGLLNGQRLGKS